MEQQWGDQGEEDSATIPVTGEGGMDQGGGRGGGRKWSDLALILNGGLTRHAGVSKLRGGRDRTQMPPRSSPRTAIYHDRETCGCADAGAVTLEAQFRAVKTRMGHAIDVKWVV